MADVGEEEAQGRSIQSLIQMYKMVPQLKYSVWSLAFIHYIDDEISSIFTSLV